MKVIIAGCGRMGSNLALDLVSDGYNVSVIDSDISKLDVLGSGFNGQRISGIEFDNDTLVEAGIKEADVFIAMTSDDSTNAMASEIAKDIFNVPRVIARVINPDKEIIYRKFGIETISLVNIGTNIIKNRITDEGYNRILNLDDDIEMVEIMNRRKKALSIKEIENKYKCRVSSINKKGEYIIPKDDDNVEPMDKFVCTIDRKNEKKICTDILREMFI